MVTVYQSVYSVQWSQCTVSGGGSGSGVTRASLTDSRLRQLSQLSPPTLTLLSWWPPEIIILLSLRGFNWPVSVTAEGQCMWWSGDGERWGWGEVRQCCDQCAVLESAPVAGAVRPAPVMAAQCYYSVILANTHHHCSCQHLSIINTSDKSTHSKCSLTVNSSFSCNRLRCCD